MGNTHTVDLYLAMKSRELLPQAMTSMFRKHCVEQKKPDTKVYML